MEKVRIENVKPGMILGRSIFLADGRILLRQKTEISANAISKLRELRLPSIYINNPIDQDIVDPVSDATRSDLIQSLYKLDFGKNDSKNINIFTCKNYLYELVDEIVRNQRVPMRFTEIRFHNDYIYSHMVNVCIIAVKIGLQMSYNQLKLAELAIGALFHDIGMTKVSAEILNRIGGLTSEEMRQVHQHSKDGYDLLRQIPGISAVSANVAYQHHERLNGTGYPRGMTGAEIHEFAKITAVADVFDAMTTEKIYSHAKSVIDTLKFIDSLKGIEFDPEVVDTLAKILD
jgi:HD-GYP domain-containing protein (c-di-GMP phosphodiesterase class II)